VHRVHNSPNLIYSPGTQVVTTKRVQAPDGRIAHPAGAVAIIVKAPMDRQHMYRVRFTDGSETNMHHDQLMLLAEFKERRTDNAALSAANRRLFDRVIFRCVIGSRAYGLDDADSDVDRRGIYLPQAVAGSEKAALAETDLEFHEAEYRRLVSELNTAATRSSLPEAPTAREAFDDLLIRLRLGDTSGGDAVP
jgi:hypothetical protein